MVVRIRESHSFLQLCFVWEKCWNGIHDQGNLIKTWWFISLLDWFCISHIASLNKCNHAKIKYMEMHCFLFLNWRSCYIYQNCKDSKLYISCTSFGVNYIFLYYDMSHIVSLKMFDFPHSINFIKMLTETHMSACSYCQSVLPYHLRWRK